MSEKFAVIDAADNVDWLFEQFDVEFDLGPHKNGPASSRQENGWRNRIRASASRRG